MTINTHAKSRLLPLASMTMMSAARFPICSIGNGWKQLNDNGLKCQNFARKSFSRNVWASILLLPSIKVYFYHTTTHQTPTLFRIRTLYTSCMMLNLSMIICFLPLYISRASSMFQAPLDVERLRLCWTRSNMFVVGMFCSPFEPFGERNVRPNAQGW